MTSRVTKAKEILGINVVRLQKQLEEKEQIYKLNEQEIELHTSTIGLKITGDRNPNHTTFESIKKIIEKNNFLSTNGDGVLIEGVIKGNVYGEWEIGIADKQGKLYHRWYGVLIFGAQWTPFPNWQFWYGGDSEPSNELKACLEEIAQQFQASIELQICRHQRIKTIHFE